MESPFDNYSIEPFEGLSTKPWSIFFIVVSSAILWGSILYGVFG